MLEICDSISEINCRKWFDVINPITFPWMTCVFMQLAAFKDFNGRQAQKCTRMEITILKIIIWGNILPDIKLELTYT